MKQRIIFISLSLILLSSCKKESISKNIVGDWKWTVNYPNNPFYTTTPQSTGIQETLSFNADGNYKLVQNGVVVSTGTYTTSVITSPDGQKALRVSHTNSRVVDSLAYCSLAYNNDSLFFSSALIGAIGGGSRHYGRQ